MVEWKTIKDICISICSGGTPSTSHKEYYNGSIPWLRTQEVDWTDVYDTEIKITEKAIANSTAKLIPSNCVIVAMYGATAAKVAINKIPLATNQACCNLEINASKADYKFVYQWLCKEYHNLKSLGEGSQHNINGKKVKEYPIPIPPLSEQNRIVGILDTFTESIENLKKQITERKQQYEHYRDQLLDLEGKPGVEMKKIDNLGNYFGGLTGKTKKDFENGNAKFITYMNVFSNASLDVKTVGTVKINKGEKQNKIQKGDILFTGSSETPDEAGMSCVVTCELEEDYYLNSFCFGLRINNHEQYKLDYFKHILRSFSIRKAISKAASGVTRFNISKARFGKIQIPIPSLEEQSRIVSILDTFEASITNLEQQLSLRQKQYEYYRNMLLTFDE